MTASTIIPTVGRKVWFYEHIDQEAPIDATIIKVWGNTPAAAVNLLCVDPNTGQTYLRSSVMVGDESTSGRHYRWMPFQKGQARPEWQQRVVDEQRELNARAERLAAFIGTAPYDALDMQERLRMSKQLSVMRELSEVLGARIGAFK